MLRRTKLKLCPDKERSSWREQHIAWGTQTSLVQGSRLGPYLLCTFFTGICMILFLWEKILYNLNCISWLANALLTPSVCSISRINILVLQNNYIYVFTLIIKFGDNNQEFMVGHPSDL